jgi:eukaryotic-like serine/threonine-protein kinase
VSADAPSGAPASAEAGSALVGTVLAGRYRILSKLGEGAMGAVYLGEHLRIGRRDAIKVLRESLEGDAEALARFSRGTRNVSLIQHPNVCTVYDFGDTDDGRRYLAMEYVPGETLQDLLRREGRLPPARAQAIFAQVAGALQAAHEAGIVHRDLKPGNVMVSPGRGGADAVKVVDFDIAKGSSDGEAGDVTRLGFVIGTPEYMSPEQLLGMTLDGRSDVYSLGIMLFRMLAGALPFRAADTQELMVQRLTGSPLRLDEVLPGLAVPAALQAALDRALQRRAEDRFDTAAAFADAVAAALAVLAAAGSPASAAFAPAAAPAEVDPHTRGGVPLTVVTSDPSQRPRDPVAPARAWRPTRARMTGGVLIALLAVAGAWGVSRGIGPPRGGESPPSVEPGKGGQTADPASADPLEETLLASADSLQRARDDSARAAGPGATVQVPAGGVPGPGTARVTPDRPPAGQTAQQSTGPAATGPARDDPPPGNEVASGSARRRETEQDGRPPPPPPGNGDGLTAENASARVGELLDRMAATSAPSPGALRNIRAVAARIYRLDGTTALVRSQAAQVAADAASQLGDPGGCVEWAERSLQARETSGARILRDQCQGLQP